MPLAMDRSRQPPGGFSYPDQSGHVLRADGIQELLAKIADYRSKNGLPAGNPYSEYEAYCAIHHPWLVSKVGATPVAREDPVSRWLNRQWRMPIKEWAESETALARYNTCLSCPHYAPEHVLSAEATRRLIILGAGRLGAMSGVCKVHHWSVALACAADKMEAATEVEGCWAGTSP